MGSRISDLVEGYHSFHQHFQEEKAYYEELANKGQNPKALVIACCDSRVDPSVLTNSMPGDLFMVRNVANLVPPFEADPRHHGTSAALEFAVLGLGVEDIIVLGHRYCGGIRALIEHEPHTAENCFINTWMNIAKPAKLKVLDEHANETIDEQAHACEKASLKVSLENLLTFPWVAERIASKKLNIHAWYFDLESGQLQAYQPESDEFTPL